MTQLFQFSHHAVGDTRDTYITSRKIFCEQETDGEHGEFTFGI